MTIHLRADRAVFRFSGPEAHKLLNDVVTGHIPASDNDIAAWWALLSPQGKILAEGLAGWAGDALWLDVHQSVADDFFKRMKMYRLRAQVAIDDLRDTHRVGFATQAQAGTISHAGRLGAARIGWRIIAPVAATAGWSGDDTAYHAARIAAGVAEQGTDFPANDAFAHDIGLDILDGIDFKKGCYVGQEVVSRMQHRGTARRRVMIVKAERDLPIDRGDVRANDRPIGNLGSVSGPDGLAIMRIDKVRDALDAGQAITVGDVPVSLSIPAWARYTLPQKDTGAEDA